jgi:hypothetical protein
LKWAHDSTANSLFRYDPYTDADDFRTEEAQEAEEEAIEQEHQDHLSLKVNPSITRTIITISIHREQFSYSHLNV